MKKTNGHSGSILRCTVSLLLTCALLTPGLLPPQKAAAADNDTTPFNISGLSEVGDHTMYTWHRIKTYEDLPQDDNWHPIIFSYESNGKTYYFDNRAFGDVNDVFKTNPYYQTYKSEVKDGKTITTTENHYLDCGFYAVGWPGMNGTNGYLPDLNVDTFYTVDDPLTSWGVLSTGEMLDEEEYYNYPFFIGRGIDFASFKGSPNTFKTYTDAKYEELKKLTYDDLDIDEDDEDASDERWEIIDDMFVEDVQNKAPDYRRATARKAKSLLGRSGTPYAKFYSLDQAALYGSQDDGPYKGVTWCLMPSNTNGAYHSYYWGYDPSPYAQYIPSGKFRIVYVEVHDTDIMLAHHDRVVYVTTNRDGNNIEEGDFSLWWGESSNIPTLTADYTVKNGRVLNIDTDIMINKGVTLTIEPGSMVSINEDTNLFNNGTIINYGTLIVQPRGTINRLMPNDYDENLGKIYCRGGTYLHSDGSKSSGEGNFLILEGAKVFLAEGEDMLRLENGATMEVNGLLVCPKPFWLSDSDLTIRPKGALLCHYGTEYKNPLATDYKVTITKGANSGSVTSSPPLKKMGNTSDAAFYAIGNYQIINNGVLMTCGTAIRSISENGITAITTVSGSGWTEKMTDNTSSEWTQTVNSGGIETITHYADGSYVITYDDGCKKWFYTDGSTFEECLEGTRICKITRDASGWYLQTISSVFVRVYTSPTTLNDGKDENLICEGCFDNSRNCFITYYYKDGEYKAGEATVEYKSGLVELYSFTGTRGNEKLGEMKGTVIKTVNSIGEKSTVVNKNVSLQWKNSYSFGTRSCLYQTMTFDTRVEEWLTVNTDKDESKQVKVPVRTTYTDGKFKGVVVNYTTITSDGKELGDYYFLQAEPQVLTDVGREVTAWRVEVGDKIIVCRTMRDAATGTYRYIVGLHAKSSYDPTKDASYTSSGQWLAVKTYTTLPNPEIYLKGWPA